MRAVEGVLADQRLVQTGKGLVAPVDTAPNPQAPPTLAVMAQQQPHRRPERAHQMLLGHDRPAHQHHDPDRLVHQLLKNIIRDATRVRTRTRGP
ncbi:MAG TPA: hypothetical protein VMD79_01965 [Solirubrobacteraceae bacterium]|nr:hypothetical protein [Solirubrobacteraceae bacterium]